MSQPRTGDTLIAEAERLRHEVLDSADQLRRLLDGLRAEVAQLDSETGRDVGEGK